MRKNYLPADSRRYSELAFQEKERRHQRRSRMSLTRKIRVLERLFEMRKDLPKIDSGQIQSIKRARPSSPPTK